MYTPYLKVPHFLVLLKVKILSSVSISLTSDVCTALSQLDSTKASGIDGIGPKLLRSCALALYPVIHHLFTIS